MTVFSQSQKNQVKGGNCRCRAIRKKPDRALILSSGLTEICRLTFHSMDL